MFEVYILYSKTLDRFYTGYTSKLDQRLEFHLNPTKTKAFTAKAKDWKIYFNLECKTKSQALAIEQHIKKMKSKIYIENLIRYPEMSAKLIEKYREM